MYFTQPSHQRTTIRDTYIITLTITIGITNSKQRFVTKNSRASWLAISTSLAYVTGLKVGWMTKTIWFTFLVGQYRDFIPKNSVLETSSIS